jgi:hypothetical protein
MTACITRRPSSRRRGLAIVTTPAPVGQAGHAAGRGVSLEWQDDSR